jgi:biopolymer transport protein ExbD
MDANEFFLKKKKAAKAARRGKEPEEASLGLTSLMDIVSIIVVYLLKSYAADPVVITPVQEQKVPMSASDAPIQDGLPLYISSREVILGSEKITTVQEGEINANDINGHLIRPLYDALAIEADKGKQMAGDREAEWPGRIILVGDESIKFKTIVDIMFTAQKAEFKEYNFCVIKKYG